MKAAIVTAPGQTPLYGDFTEPSASEGMEVIQVSASALSQLTKARASGAHYSAEGLFPAAAGVDGIGRTADGRRVYFALPETPYGALAEKSLVRAAQCVPVPDELDDITAAAIANPGMSAWAALMERAHLQPGETVLINGATSTAGRIAVQLAKYMGAGRVIGTGRNETELKELLSLGADAVISFSLDANDPAGAKGYEKALCEEFARGVDVVVDYLWGESARTILAAIVKAVEDAHPVRFVHVGAASGEPSIDLPGAALRSSAIQLMGSGLKSVPLDKLLAGIRNVFAAVVPAKLKIATKVVPLSAIAENWEIPAKPRVVCTMG